MTSRATRTIAVVLATVAGALVTLAVAWIRITYVTAAALPIPGIGNANLAVGLGLGVLGVATGTGAAVAALLTRN